MRVGRDCAEDIILLLFEDHLRRDVVAAIDFLLDCGSPPWWPGVPSPDWSGPKRGDQLVQYAAGSSFLEPAKCVLTTVLDSLGASLR